MEMIALAVSIAAVGLAILSTGFLERKKERVIEDIIETSEINRRELDFDNLAELYEEKGDSATEYSNYRFSNIGNVKKEVEEINTDLHNVSKEDIEEYINNTLYTLELHKTKATEILETIKENYDVFNKNIYEKQMKGENINTESYINNLINIVKICKKKYEELDKSYGEIIKTIKEKKNMIFRKIDSALK
ncbi:MAG: hypothetical protein U9P44_01260 [archaeon]|nr:hypothetical protein [archaeon]